MKVSTILITGATGCTGSYVVTELLRHSQAHLLLLSSPKTLLENWQVAYPDRITWIPGRLNSLLRYSEQLPEPDLLLHLGVCWGGPETFLVNVRQTQQLWQWLPPTTRRVAFSTASVINAQQQFETAASRLGTDYIRSKAAFYQWLQASPLREHTTLLYPTVILGGDSEHPYTPFSQALFNLPHWLPYVRHLQASGCFHFIHAQDIARLILHWSETGNWPSQAILGNPALSINQALSELGHYFNQPWQPRVNLDDSLRWLVPLLRNQMSDWDRFSLRHRMLNYPDVVSPARLGMGNDLATLSQCLKAMGIESLK